MNSVKCNGFYKNFRLIKLSGSSSAGWTCFYYTSTSNNRPQHAPCCVDKVTRNCVPYTPRRRKTGTSAAHALPGFGGRMRSRLTRSAIIVRHLANSTASMSGTWLWLTVTRGSLKSGVVKILPLQCVERWTQRHRILSPMALCLVYINPRWITLWCPLLDLMTSRRDTANRRKTCEKLKNSPIQHFALYFLHVMDAGASGMARQHSRVVYNAKPLSHTVACCRGNWVVYFKPPRTTLSRSRPWPPNAGSGPPRKGGKAKNLYSTSERLSVAEWLVLGLYVRQMILPRKTKTYATLPNRRSAVTCIGVKKQHLLLQYNVLCKGWFSVASTICDLKCCWENFSHIVSHKY